MRATAPLVVLGLGPAGRAIAHRAAAAGLHVQAYDPAPDARWIRTFGLWSDELPPWLPAEVVAARSSPTVHAGVSRSLGREYAMLNVDRLQDALRLDGVRVHAERATRAGHGDAFVVDARGLGPDEARSAARQTAVGVLVPAAVWPPTWMDWRPAPGVPDDAPASFLYAVPVAADAVLVEETSLAANPPVSTTELHVRLRARLAARAVDGGAVVESVDFPLLARGPRRGRNWCGVGVRGTTLHPATGYSIAGSLAFADRVVAAMRAGRNPVTSADVAAHRLRTSALRALVAMDPVQQRRFFETFFGLPDQHVRAFLSARSGPAATAGTMTAAFAAAPTDLRLRLASGVSLPWLR